MNDLLVYSDNAYIHASTSDSTRREYIKDITHFLNHGGSFPATPEIVVHYLMLNAPHLNPRTLERTLVGLSQWHKLQGIDNPVKSLLVRKTMKGIKRIHGKPRKQALALRLEELQIIIDWLKKDHRKISVRNIAMITIGFFGAFRCSEVVALQWNDIQFVRDGIIITLKRSKTDQYGESTTCVIPFGKPQCCAVRALMAWREISGITEGYIFRRISKTGNVLADPIHRHHFLVLFKNIVKQIDLPYADKYSLHSLRRGFATESCRLGASLPAIKKHGRWRTMKAVIEYIDVGRQFVDSAVNVLIK